MTTIARQVWYQDQFEYHGNTMVEQIRKLKGRTLWRKWLLFNSVEEAEQFFNNYCAIPEYPAVPASFA